MSNYIVNAETDYGTMVAASSHRRTVEHSLGDMRRTGHRWVVGWNYVSYYNWSLRNWEFVGGEAKKRMRGEPILLNRVIIVLILIFTIITSVQVNNSALSKYYLAATVFIGLVGVINTIWNWRVYIVNGNRIHPHMFYVSDSILDSSNEFYEIPIHTRITDRDTLVIAHELGAAIGQLIQQNQSSTSVKIMAYGNLYLKRISFPKESILVFLLSIGAILAAGFFFVPLFF